MSGADFNFVSTTCGASLAPATSCAITVRFAPSAAASRTGTLTVSTGAGNFSASLSGTGQRAELRFAYQGNQTSPAINWGTQLVGGWYPSASAVTVTNAGNVAASAMAFGTSSGFSLTANNCTSTLAVGASCSFQVVWSPTAAQVYSGSVTATTSSGTALNSVALQGTAITPPSIVASTGTVTGSSSYPTAASGSVTFTNNGQTATTLTLSAPAGTSRSPATLSCPASSSCGSVTVTSGTGIGSYTGSLGITSSAGGSVPTVSVSLTVNGSQATLTSATVLNLGSVFIGASAPQASWTFRNDGNSAMTISLSALNSPFSVVSNGCTSVAAGSTCAITVQMSTGTAGSYAQSSIGLSGASIGNRNDLGMSGTVTPSTTTLGASPTSLSWGTVPKGVYVSRVVTVTNTGATAATGLSYAVSGSGPAGFYTLESMTCPAAGGSLAAGASCNVTVTYEARCVGGTVAGTFAMTGSNFSALSVPLSATTRSTGVCAP